MDTLEAVALIREEGDARAQVAVVTAPRKALQARNMDQFPLAKYCKLCESDARGEHDIVRIGVMRARGQRMALKAAASNQPNSVPNYAQALLRQLGVC
jgi:hypothetical protein